MREKWMRLEGEQIESLVEFAAKILSFSLSLSLPRNHAVVSSLLVIPKNSLKTNVVYMTEYPVIRKRIAFVQRANKRLCLDLDETIASFR